MRDAMKYSGLFHREQKDWKNIANRVFVCEMVGASAGRRSSQGSCRDPQVKALGPFGKTSLHAATAEQHRDAPFDARPKALAILELRTLLVGFALRRLGAATLCVD
jgi:hypothetical protein